MVRAAERDRPLAAEVDGALVGAHDRRDPLVLRGVRDETRHVVGRRHVVRQQAGRVGVVCAVETELRGFLVHPADESDRAVRRDARQGTRRGVVRRDQQQVQQVVGRDLVVEVQVRRRRLEHVASGNRDHLTQIRVVLEEHRRRHHLGDAGDRALLLRVLFPENLIGFGIVDDRGGGANIGHHLAAGVDLVARQHRVGHLARGGAGAGDGEFGLARLRGLGGCTPWGAFLTAAASAFAAVVSWSFADLVVLACALVAASDGVAPRVTRPDELLSEPTQKTVFLIT